MSTVTRAAVEHTLSGLIDPNLNLDPVTAVVSAPLIFKVSASVLSLNWVMPPTYLKPVGHKCCK